MTEFVAIPKDLFEKMADAVGELRTIYAEEDDDEVTQQEPEAVPEFDRIAELVDEIEENWPEESFTGGYPTQGTGQSDKFVRQTKLSGPNQPR